MPLATGDASRVSECISKHSSVTQETDNIGWLLRGDWGQRDGVVERNTFHCELFGTNLSKRKGHFLLKSHFRSFSWNENFTGLRLSCKCHYRFVLLFCGLLYHPVLFIFITSSFSWATISKCTLCLIDHSLLIWSQVIFFLPTSELLFLKCESFWIAFVSYIRSFLHIGGILRKILDR